GRRRGHRRRHRWRRHGTRIWVAGPRRPRRGTRRTAPDLDARRWRHSRESGDPVLVVIAEDSLLLREGLERLLADNGFEVVGSCDTADDLLAMVNTRAPDVAIVDIRLPPTHSDEGLRAA